MGESTTWKQRRAFTQLVRNELWHYRLWSFKTRDTKLERFSGFFDFFRSNSFIFEAKVEKIYMGVFPLILCH
jgi:hypothetical protein